MATNEAIKKIVEEQEQKRELEIYRLMTKIGETFDLNADHFIAIWPNEDPKLITEAVKRLKNPTPREGQPRR